MSVSYSILWPVVFFPLLGALFAYLVGLKHKQLAGWIATGASGAALFYVAGLTLLLPHGRAFEQRLFEWLAVGDLQAALTLRFDALGAVMSLVVAGVGTLIHLYAIGYMAGDPAAGRFFAYLNLFLAAMLLLVSAANLPVLFIGWEGVALCSYLLIGFWFKKEEFAGAANKAFIVNRIGDACFLLGIFLLYLNFGTLDFSELRLLIERHPELSALYGWVGICLFIGASGKSAQIPLFVWLPDAMAAPTPVSALIHAATMVTAGVYMMVRLNYLYALAPLAMLVVLVVAVLTAFLAATIALAQDDIKKVLAYSTISQLGFMFMAAAAGAYWVAVFHIITHAFFKACLFLSAGSVMHCGGHEQNMRKMGGLWRKMPLTAMSFAVAGLSLAGMAPLAGYYSKHACFLALQSGAFETWGRLAELALLLAWLTAFVTALYIARAFSLIFLGPAQGNLTAHEPPWKMNGAVLTLAVLSVFSGYFLALPHALQHYLRPLFSGPYFNFDPGGVLEALFVHSWPGLLGVLVGLSLYLKAPWLIERIKERFPFTARLFRGKYYVDEIYALLIVRPLERLSVGLWRFVDQGLIDGTVNGGARLVDALALVVSRVQSGQVRHYALFVFSAAVLLAAFYMVF